MTSIAQKGIQEELEEALEHLKQKSNMGHHLKVIWVPKKVTELCGEVKGDTIYIYEENRQNAIETLEHEFIDYFIGQVTEPYKKIINAFISIQNKDAYEKKEKAVEGLRRLFE